MASTTMKIFSAFAILLAVGYVRCGVPSGTSGGFGSNDCRLELVPGGQVEGGDPLEDIDDIAACKQSCRESEPCVGIDYNFSDQLYMGVRCFHHTDETLATGDVVPNGNVNHYRKVCGGEDN